MNSGEVTLADLENRAFKVADKFSDNINLIVNEPSLALFRIQEHVRATLPPLVERKCEMAKLQKNIQGAVFGTEDAINAVKCMESSSVHFKNIQDLLKNAMFMRQQLKHKNMKKKEQSRLASSTYPRNVVNTAEGAQTNNPPTDGQSMNTQ